MRSSFLSEKDMSENVEWLVNINIILSKSWLNIYVYIIVKYFEWVFNRVTYLLNRLNIFELNDDLDMMSICKI